MICYVKFNIVLIHAFTEGFDFTSLLHDKIYTTCIVLMIILKTNNISL